MLEIGGCRKTLLLSLLKEGKAVALFWPPGEVMRPLEPPLELLATSVVVKKVAIIVIGIHRRCRLRWLSGCRRAGSKTAAVSVQPFLLRFVLLWLLRKWLGAEVLVAGDFELRQKGLCETLGYGIAF
ncbi:uncharacterized protein LOC130957582 [Arachis stenosperma]|uniref:uncharacterized protein LOC130957582 n=1 Tax=Arachis stenosperma TaxID=217475 RepID=UPI0025AD7EBE|nr:uncharacterized protein LOC130957582 [Arachis stenosperma]XP_057740419.1 uncharacterized protein LOC130957582 [Arachis stenosperma]